MKIDVLENEIKIKDDASSQFFILKFLLVLNSVTGILYATRLFTKGVLFPHLLLATLGLLSIIFLIYINYFKSYKEQYKVSEIRSVTEKTVIGRSFIRLKLNNGKIRDIGGFKLKEDIFKEINKIETFLNNQK